MSPHHVTISIENRQLKQIHHLKYFTQISDEQCFNITTRLLYLNFSAGLKSKK